MARKGWTTLSPDYRKRLEKNGISKKAYESGASIQKARGHQHTPERPTQASVNKFPRYVRERDRLINIVTTRKNAFFNTSPKWNPRIEAERFKRFPPSLAYLRFFSTLSKQEWLDAIQQRDPDTIQWLGYH